FVERHLGRQRAAMIEVRRGRPAQQVNLGRHVAVERVAHVGADPHDHASQRRTRTGCDTVHCEPPGRTYAHGPDTADGASCVPDDVHTMPLRLSIVCVPDGTVTVSTPAGAVIVSVAGPATSTSGHACRSPPLGSSDVPAGRST